MLKKWSPPGLKPGVSWAECPSGHNHPRPEGRGFRPRGIKILFIDDERDIIIPLAYWFNSLGYISLTASDNEEAMKVLREESPGLIFLDIHLPQTDGFEILKNIIASNRTVPVIMMSALIGNNVKERAGQDIAGVYYKGDDFSKTFALVKAVLHLP